MMLMSQTELHTIQHAHRCRVNLVGLRTVHCHTHHLNAHRELTTTGLVLSSATDWLYASGPEGFFFSVY